MDFRNLQRQINNLSAKQEVTQAEVLELMSILCEDVRHFGKKAVENCEAGDQELLIDGLYNIGFTLNILYDKHKQAIIAQGQTHSEKEMWEKLQESEAVCSEAKGRLHQLGDISQQLRRREEELQSLLSEESTRQAKVAEYSQKIAEAEQQLSRMKGTQLPELIERYSALEREHKEKQALLLQMQQQASEKENELEAFQSQLAQKALAVKALQTEKSDLEQHLTAACAAADRDKAQIHRMREQLAEMEQAAAQMMKEHALLQASIESQTSDNTILRDETLIQAQKELDEVHTQTHQLNQQLAQLKSEREKVGAQVNETGTLIETKRLDLEHKQRQYNEKKETLEALNAQISTITANFEPLLAEINDRKEKLEGMNAAQIEEDLRINRDQWQAQIDEAAEKQKQILALQEQIAEKAKEIDVLENQVEDLSQEKANKEAQYRELEQSVNMLQHQLEALGSAEYAEKIMKLQNQQQVLQAIRANMEQHAIALGLSWTTDVHSNLDHSLQQSAMILELLKSSVREYAAAWQKELNSSN